MTFSRNDEGKKPTVSFSDFNVDASTRMEVEEDALAMRQRKEKEK